MSTSFATITNTNYNKCKTFYIKRKTRVTATPQPEGEQPTQNEQGGASEFKAYSPLPFLPLINIDNSTLSANQPLYFYLHLLEKIPATETFSFTFFRVFVSKMNMSNNLQVAIYELDPNATIGDNTTYNTNSSRIAYSNLETITGNGFHDLVFDPAVNLTSSPNKHYFIALYSSITPDLLTNLSLGDTSMSSYEYSGTPGGAPLNDPSQQAMNNPDIMSNIPHIPYYALYR